MIWLALVIVVGTRTSEYQAPFLVESPGKLTRKYARPLKFFTHTGSAGSALVVVFCDVHVGAAKFEMSMTPKTNPPPKLKPGWVMMILVPIKSMDGGVHAPDVAGLAGVFANVAPVKIGRASCRER